MAAHPSAATISFTGSSQTGKELASKAGMIPLQMELGGKDCAIVLPDADLELAASNIVKGGFAFSGQRCTAVKVVAAFAAIADDLVNKVVEKANSLKVGMPGAFFYFDPRSYHLLPEMK